VNRILDSELPLANKIVCGLTTGLTVQALEPLRSRGAAVCTLAPVPAFESQWCVLHGEDAARKEMRKLLRDVRLHVFELDSGGDHSFHAGVAVLSRALPLLLDNAMRHLRASGFNQSQARMLTERMTARALRVVSTALRPVRGVESTLEQELRELLHRHLDAPATAQPPASSPESPPMLSVSRSAGSS